MLYFLSECSVFAQDLSAPRPLPARILLSRQVALPIIREAPGSRCSVIYEEKQAKSIQYNSEVSLVIVPVSAAFSPPVSCVSFIGSSIHWVFVNLLVPNWPDIDVGNLLDCLDASSTAGRLSTVRFYNYGPRCLVGDWAYSILPVSDSTDTPGVGHGRIRGCR